MSKFRFEDLEIWKQAVQLSNKLFDIANDLEKNKQYRFAEQLRGAGLSITNNIAEGSGSSSKKEFIIFLNYSRRSVFECANIIYVLYLRKYISNNEKEELYIQLDSLSKRIMSFKKTLTP